MPSSYVYLRYVDFFCVLHQNRAFSFFSLYIMHKFLVLQHDKALNFCSFLCIYP